MNRSYNPPFIEYENSSCRAGSCDFCESEGVHALQLLVYGPLSSKSRRVEDHIQRNLRVKENKILAILSSLPLNLLQEKARRKEGNICFGGGMFQKIKKEWDALEFLWQPMVINLLLVLQDDISFSAFQFNSQATKELIMVYFLVNSLQNFLK